MDKGLSPSRARKKSSWETKTRCWRRQRETRGVKKSLRLKNKKRKKSMPVLVRPLLAGIKLKGNGT